MSLALPYERERGRYLAINIAHWLVGGAFGALTFDPLIGSPSAGLFLMLGLALLATNPASSLRSIVKWWPMLLLPVYCLVSTVWSQFPSSTLRYSVQLALTLGLAIVIADRIGAKSMLRLLFTVYSLGMLASLVLHRESGDGAWRGFFGSKNAFAAYLVVYMIAAVGVLLDDTARRWLRLLALAGALVSVPLLVKAQSAGALITIGPCVAAMVMVQVLRFLTPSQKLFALALAGLAAAAAAVVAINFSDAILGAVLESSGKDSTLTGRTDLWAFGLTYIADHPLLGMGYRAFWVPGFAPAEQLWAMFMEPSGAGFNFHDLYISNAVDLGLIGLGIEVAIIYLGLVLTGVWAFVRPNAVTAFLFGLQLLLVLRSFVEVEVFFEFSVRSILVYCTLMYAIRGLSDWRAERRAERVEAMQYALPSLRAMTAAQGRYRHG